VPQVSRFFVWEFQIMTILHTNRLIMRPYDDSDFDRMAELHGTQTVMAHMRDGAIDRDEARRYFESYLSDWAKTGISVWALLRGADSAYIGECGFWVREGFPGKSLRYILAESYWNQGYGLEAATAALRWGFEEKNISWVSAVSHTANSGSVRILERLGLTIEDTAHKGMEAFHRYSVSREVWVKQKAVT
jgi:RimJ/RimL family protein N-acetyltransferase